MKDTLVISNQIKLEKRLELQFSRTNTNNRNAHFWKCKKKGMHFSACNNYHNINQKEKERKGANERTSEAEKEAKKK